MQQACARGMDATEMLKQITLLYSDFVEHAAEHPASVSRAQYQKLLEMRNLISQFLGTAFGQNPALAAALHEIRSQLAKLESAQEAENKKRAAQNNLSPAIILPPAISLPHHVVYADDPAFEPLSLRRFALVRTPRGLKIVTHIVCTYPIQPQDFDYWLHKAPNQLDDYFLYSSKVITAQQLTAMRPSMVQCQATTGSVKMASSPNPPPPIVQKQLALAMKAPMSRSQFRLCCGIHFYCQDVIFGRQDSTELQESVLIPPGSQYYSPFSKFQIGEHGRLYNYAQVQPLFDPFEDLIAARTTGLCAYFDKNELQFKLGKVVALPARTNRFHYTLQKVHCDLGKLREKIENKPVLSVLGECTTAEKETFLIFSKFVCSLVGCQGVCDDILMGLVEGDAEREAVREGFVARWVEGVVGKWEAH